MNIEVISSASEETLISFGVFACAFAFTLWKIYSIQRSKIQFYESQDELGRQSMQNELETMDNLIAALEEYRTGSCSPRNSKYNTSSKTQEF